jgi:5-methylcytosine-specific restriction endonuclease McrA
VWKKDKSQIGGDSTNEKVYYQVMNRADGECEVCNKVAALELHHILRRRVKETQTNCIMLCHECHQGTFGVHGREGHELDVKLKQKLQTTYFEQGYKEFEVRAMMGGKLY